MNDTSEDKPENVAAALIVIISTMASIAGNGLVMLSYFICPKLRGQPGSALVANLALSDFFCGVYVQIPCVVNLADPTVHFNGSMCVVHSIFTWTILSSSNWTLAAISADRTIAILKPFQHTQWITNFRIRCFVAVVWLFSLIFSASVINKTSVTYSSWELMCSPRWSSDNATAGILASILCFWTPTAILVGCNFAIIYTVRNLRQIASHSPPEEAGQVNITFGLKDNTKTLRSLYVLVVVYFLCSSPYFLAKFSFLKREKGMLPPSMVVLTILLMFLASALNPFIYALLRKDHKHAFWKTLTTISEKVRSLRVNHLNFGSDVP